MTTETLAPLTAKELAAAVAARTSSVARNLLALAEGYAEVRHTCGAPEYNARAAHARNLLITAISQALATPQTALATAAADLRAIASTSLGDYARKAASSAENALTGGPIVPEYDLTGLAKNNGRLHIHAWEADKHRILRDSVGL